MQEPNSKTVITADLVTADDTEWGEVSEILYLFRGRKWTDQDAKQWLLDAWNYLGYAN